MKKIVLLLAILLLPIVVYADTCDNSKIVISDVTKVESNGYVQEISNPSISNQNISTSLKFYEVGDSITYSFKIKNNSTDDYDLGKRISSDKYSKYEIISNSKVIKSGEEQTILLKITYKEKVDDSLYENGKYIEKNELNIVLGDSIINPNTGFIRLVIVLFIMLVIIVSSIIVIAGNKKYLSLLVLLFIPLFVDASCQYKIAIISDIEYIKKVPNNCTFDGELVQGTEYVNGQYTYRYMQEWNMGLGEIFDWINISDDGWGVRLTDLNSTDPVTSSLCTTINDKPIVSMSAMFIYSQATSIDLSSFDTSNVTNMLAMFAGTQATTLDLSSFDTSNVTNMFGMFAGNGATSIDLSNFNTSNVTNMNSMFAGAQATSLDLSSFNTSNVTNMSNMFGFSQATTIDLSSFDTSSVTDMSHMFGYSQASTLDLSSFDTRNVTTMESMFYLSQASTLDLSNFNTSNVTNMGNMFYQSQATTLDVSSFDTSNVTNMEDIFESVHVDTINLSNFDFSNCDSIGSVSYYNGDIKLITDSDEKADILEGVCNYPSSGRRVLIYSNSTLRHILELQ